MSPPGPRARAALAAMLAGAACAQLPFSLLDDDRPPVEVLAIAARFPTETSGQVDLRLAIPNRRDETLLASLVTWEIWVDGHLFSTGLQSLSFEVAPREERVLYITMPLAFRKMPLRPGPVRLLIGARGRVTARFGPDGVKQGLSFARQMEILCDGAPTFPLPGDSLE